MPESVDNIPITNPDVSKDTDKSGNINPGNIPSGMVIFNVLAGILIAISIFFRIWHINNIPGLNGDETFFGSNAITWLRHGPLVWKTPNGNVVDPFLQIPAILLACLHGPSTALLRIPALTYGICALFVAAWFGRKVLGPGAGVAFALILAVLPEDIVQSRFGWEPSQSVLVDTITLFCSLMIVKDSGRSRYWCLWAAISFVIGLICHPTNIFIGIFLILSILMRYQGIISPLLNPRISKIKAIGIWILIALIIGAGIFLRTHATAGDIKVSYDENSTLAFIIFLSRLFSGITGLRYIAGSWQPGEVSGASISELDISTLAIITLSVIYGVWRTCRKNSNIQPSDKLLFLGSALLLVGFYVVAGARALTPGNERFALVLIAPVIASVCRAFDLATTDAKLVRAAVATIALLVSGGWLIMFYNGYFAHIEQTAGTASSAFLTGPVEPKLAAWREIEAENTNQDHVGFVITTAWWNSSPLTYFALENKNNKLVVIKSDQLTSDAAKREVVYAQMLGRVWYVEFARSQELWSLESQLNSADIPYTEKIIYGYAHVPVEVVIHVTGAKPAT